jgi:hypothetical protein
MLSDGDLREITEYVYGDVFFIQQNIESEQKDTGVGCNNPDLAGARDMIFSIEINIDRQILQRDLIERSLNENKRREAGRIENVIKKRHQ